MRLSPVLYVAVMAGMPSVSAVRIGSPPSRAAIVGAVVGAILLLSFAVLLFFCRRRRLSNKPVDKIGGVERGLDPDIDSSSLLDEDGQPAVTDGAGAEDVGTEDGASKISSKRGKKLISAVANGIAQGANLTGDAVLGFFHRFEDIFVSAVANGIAQGANLTGDAVLGFHRRLFKRPTIESPAEMELEPSELISEEPPTDSCSPEILREGFLARIRKPRENTTKSTAETELQPSASVSEGEDPANSPPEIAREGFFAKITRKAKKNWDSTVSFVDDAGLTFQERLFKRPTADSTTTDAPEVEVEPAMLVSEEPTSIQLGSQPDTSEASLARKPKPSFAGDTILGFPQRLFKRTATEPTSVENGLDKQMEPPTISKNSTTSPSQNGSLPNNETESLLKSPSPGFILKLRHKFSKPSVLPDPESAPKTVLESSAASDAQDVDNAETTALRLGIRLSCASSLSRSATSRHNHQATPFTSSTSNVEPADTPLPFDADIPQSASSSAPLARSFSTMKRDQTRAILGELDDQGSNTPTYIAPPSDPPPTEAAPETRSLSMMKRDQTRVISRDQARGATDVLVQTPGGLQLMPGQSRIISTDESRAVASELRDLREYIRVLEADLAAGRRTPEYIPAAPPPSYAES
ncbi:hypothetical protein FB451DRAFT_1493397 [Mycena latifolia]|nr:hypothetical protein FB451DRAFT_1493397 [Mycena latifolia]